MTTTDPMRVWLTRLSLGAGVAFTATAEYQLARALGANQVIAAMLPVAVDAYVIAALRWFRAFDITLSLSLMGAAQISAHLLDAHVMRVNIPMVVVVSLLVPVAIWRTHALARRPGTPVPAVPEPAQVAQIDTPAEAEKGVALSLPEPVEPERVPATAPAYPAIPQAVPDGARLLPIVPVPTVRWYETPKAVSAADQPPPRPQVHAEYVPDPEDASPPPPAEDLLTPQARDDFKGDITAGRTPPIRVLRDTYSIGQVRAQRIQRELSTT